MNIEQLQYFYAVCQYQTFSQAAVKMNISQSALSKQIAKLEQTLDVVLFDRSHRQIILTDVGKQLLDDIIVILQDYEKMKIHLKNIKETQQNRIKIAMFPILSQYNLAYKLNHFSKLYPHIHLQIDEIEERDLHKSNICNYDIYILRGFFQELEHFQHFPLFQDKLVAVVSKSHPLSQHSHISLLQLKNEQFLLLPKYTKVHSLIMNACQQAGFYPKIKRHGRLETILSGISENEGITLVMEKSLQIFDLSQVNIIPLNENIEATIQLYYSSNSYTQEAIQKLIAFMKK